MKNTALIIIDIQNDYFPGGRMEQIGAVEAGLQAKNVLEFFRVEKLPVFHIQHESVGPDAGFLLKGTRGMKIHECVKPIDDEVVVLKHFPNSFKDTTLLQNLKDNKIESLIVVGMMTLMCVDSTVRAAFDLGFKCTVLGDATAACDLSYQGKTIPAEQVKGAFLSALEMVFAVVQNTPEFINSQN